MFESQVDAQAEADGISSADYARQHVPALIGELLRAGLGEPWRSTWQASSWLKDLRVLDRQDGLAARPPARTRSPRRRS